MNKLDQDIKIVFCNNLYSCNVCKHKDECEYPQILNVLKERDERIKEGLKKIFGIYNQTNTDKLFNEADK